jgi:hypothetical protein
MFFMARQTAPTLPGSEGRERIMTISGKRMAHYIPKTFSPLFSEKAGFLTKIML